MQNLAGAPLHKRECVECGYREYSALNLTIHIKCPRCGDTMSQPKQHHDHDKECV